ncbi:MAG TPA: protein-disulfide reductase DsbD domain-containing protein [Chitinophagaceae bacterium]|nr:protein-disulfide reductase DsbD domain-containing protein [Chitinophagaceae bacterium]
MKKLVSLLILSSVAAACFSQEENPVKWTFSAKKIADKSYEIHLTAVIEKEWHIYSQATPDGGPVPTSISYFKNPLLVIQGEAKEMGKLEKHFEKLFDVEVMQFSEKVDFVQTVNLKTNVKTNLTGKVAFMTCNDEMCLPPKSIPFSIALK